jgi:hypothetical protein
MSRMTNKEKYFALINAFIDERITGTEMWDQYYELWTDDSAEERASADPYGCEKKLSDLCDQVFTTMDCLIEDESLRNSAYELNEVQARAEVKRIYEAYEKAVAAGGRSIETTNEDHVLIIIGYFVDKTVSFEHTRTKLEGLFQISRFFAECTGSRVLVDSVLAAMDKYKSNEDRARAEVKRIYDEYKAKVK